ncbi:MAG: hypothetical protein IH940_08200 [Acidobacteria bacterium]|nr:hypothetical protein [Acidobacteriota bacterium]
MNRPTDPLQRVRSDCAWVAANSKLVHIEPDRLRDYSSTINSDAVAPNDPGRVALRDVETTVGFVVSLDAINFGSGYFPHLDKRPHHSGYHTIAAAWRERWNTAPPTVEELGNLDRHDCATLFGQEDADDVAQELMAHFAEALAELSTMLIARFGGRFTAMVEDCNHSAAVLTTTLRTCGSFEDVASYESRTVAFYKRAQITAFDLSRALGGQGLGRFDDLDRLTMFADNLVPHVLRLDGVLRLEDRLIERIDRGELLEGGSPAEVEIRACAVHAVEMLVAELASQGVYTNAATVDGILWERGAGDRYKAVPRHRTRCVFY